MALIAAPHFDVAGAVAAMGGGCGKDVEEPAAEVFKRG